MNAARKPLLAANWKMNKTPEEALAFWREFSGRLSGESERVEVVICPPYPALPALDGADLRARGVYLGAQNVHWEPRGAFTGEVSPGMLRAVGCSHVIVGHSERRAYFGESDEAVKRKLQAALDEGMTPILCVGETLEQRTAGRAEAVVAAQLTAALAGLDVGRAARVVVAYEPVWAIGTGRSAEARDAGEMAAAVRRRLRDLAGPAAEEIRILYGGSVAPDNFAQFLAEAEVDGGLVGTASLRPESFFALVAAAAKAAAAQAGKGEAQ
ncbi:MAG: triose-phosphate isomerase [Kyrpidia tusciae]|nr:triose-phosphate isomerase [Kyrpidia tusciae]MBE3552268.1 triose-phosphate isomerase [Kyrpidia tusciae]